MAGLLESGTVATQSDIACQEGITRARVKGCARREGLNNSLSREERVKRLEEVGKQRTRQPRGEAVQLAAAIPDSPAQFTDKTPVLYREGYEYYRTPRGEHPNAPARYVFTSLARQMDFFPFDQIDTSHVRFFSLPGLMLTPYITVRTGITGQKNQKSCS